MSGRIITKQGRDRTELFVTEAERVRIPLRLPLACAWAESGQMNEAAERWGTHTADAKTALANGDRGRLASIITAVWPDISFGLCQRIVKYHWDGDHSASVDNVLAVRQRTLQDVARDVHEMCAWLASDYSRAELARAGDAENYAAHIGDDIALGALVIYNAGHWPLAVDTYWSTHGANVDNYRRGLAYADEILADMDAAPAEPATGGEWKMTIEGRAAQLGNEKLGNEGTPYSPVCEWSTSAGPMRFQQYWHCGILEYPIEPSDSNPDGRDCLVMIEGTLPEADRTRFQS